MSFLLFVFHFFFQSSFFPHLFSLQSLKDQSNRTYGYDAAMPVCDVMCDSKTQIGCILLKESYRKIGSYISVFNPTTAGKDSQNIFAEPHMFQED